MIKIISDHLQKVQITKITIREQPFVLQIKYGYQN